MVEVSAVACLSVVRPRNARGRPQRHAFMAAVLATGLLADGGTAFGGQSPGSYHYLSDPAKAFIDRLDGVGDGNGQLDDEVRYNALTESKRTTLEAIMHALCAQGLLDLVTAVTAIWGEVPRSTQGLDQFRLSVALVEGAPARLRNSGYPDHSRNAHVKLANGDRVSRSDAATTRQPGGHPSMQVSWRISEPTVGEIDIDYIPFGQVEFSLRFLANVVGMGHTSPQNSDVRADPPGHPPNYDEHVRRYGFLERWWTR